MIWNRRKSCEDKAEAASLRQESEASEQEAIERVRVPLRAMRERNHVAEEIVRLIREGGAW